MIKPGELQNREGLGEAEAEAMNGRPAAPSTRPRRSPQAPESNETEAQQALMDRIAKAKALQPKDAERHCVDCWQKGRDAAIRVLEGAGP